MRAHVLARVLSHSARILAAAALTLTATLTQCGDPPGIRGGDTPCPRPQPNVYFAGTGPVIDRLYSTHPGCTDKWFLKVREDSNGREVWFETSRDAYGGCPVGATWKSSVFGSACE